MRDGRAVGGVCFLQYSSTVLVDLTLGRFCGQHHVAQLSPELHRGRVVVAGASFCVSLDVGTTAHRMFFRSVFWQMEAVN